MTSHTVGKHNPNNFNGTLKPQKEKDEKCDEYYSVAITCSSTSAFTHSPFKFSEIWTKMEINVVYAKRWNEPKPPEATHFFCETSRNQP